MNIKELHQEIIDALREGDFVGPIEKFYAEDVVAQANDDPPATGRDAIAAAEKEYVEGVTAFHGIKVHATAIDDQGDGNGVVFYECEMHWEHKGRPKVDINQTVVERWKNGKIASIRFYGDIHLQAQQPSQVENWLDGEGVAGGEVFVEGAFGGTYYQPKRGKHSRIVA